MITSQSQAPYESSDIKSEFYSRYEDWIQIYTDGSKDAHTHATGVAFIVLSGNFEYSKRATDYISVFATGLLRYTTVQWVFQKNIKKALICSDSARLTITSL